MLSVVVCAVCHRCKAGGKDSMNNAAVKAYRHSKHLFVTLFIFHFWAKYLNEQTSTRLSFQSKDALQWWGSFSCVCFSCRSAVSFCCEEQWLMGRCYHPTKTVPWYSNSWYLHGTIYTKIGLSRYVIFTSLPCEN